MLMASNDFFDPTLRPWGRGRAAQRKLVFERARIAVDASERCNDDSKHRNTYDNDKHEQYEITEDERDRYCDYENQDDDECIQQMNAQDKYRFVTNRQKRASQDARARYMTAPADEPCFRGRNKDSSRGEILIQSQGVQDARPNYEHEQIRFSDISENRGDRYRNEKEYRINTNIDTDVHAGHQHNYSRYPGEASLHENSTFADGNKSRGPEVGAQGRVYDADHRMNLGSHDLGRQSLSRSDGRAAASQRDPLNTAMYEPRSDLRNEQGSGLDLRGRQTPHSNVSEGIMEQQMQLMGEMFRMLSTQNQHMREQANAHSRIKVKPEKFSGSAGSSFHSFLAQFENCAEINQWNEEERRLMLRSSLTGNALQILWDLGSDKEYSYEELVAMLTARYGSKGQAESFRMQLRARRQSKGESLSSLMQDIRKIITFAYPGRTSSLVEELARDAFIEALYDRNLALQVMIKEPKGLDDAFQLASKLNAYNELISHESVMPKNTRYEKNESVLPRTNRYENKTHAIYEEDVRTKETKGSTVPSQEFKEMQEALTTLAKKVSELSGSTKSEPIEQQQSARPIICYECNREGHKRPECPYRREGNQRYATRGRGYNVRFRRDSGYSPRRTNDTRARTDTSTERSRSDRDKHVNSTGEGSIYATLVVNGQSQTCLIDCGSEISIIPEELATGLEREESDKVLLAANSTQISQLGEVIVKVEIGEHTTTSKMLVSDQVESIILGLDWLMTNKGRIDFETCVLTVKGIDIQLHHSEPRQTILLLSTH